MTTSFFFSGDESDFQTLIESYSFDQIILLADANSNGFCLHILKKIRPFLNSCSIIVIPQGEQSKNLDTCTYIWDQLNSLNAGRSSLLINVGGGVITDIGGFTASIFKRGIQFINIPTTLLSMVDACYGGKTGIDYHNYKNQLGTYSNPMAIYINPIFLQTLDQRKTKSGIAETIKHVLLSSNEWWNEIQHYSFEDFISIDTIKKSIEVKMSFVKSDPYDTGIRQALNLGHTIGHAIESYSFNTSTPLLHGEAIILGLIHELKISQSIFEFPTDIIDQLIQLKSIYFPQLNFTYNYHNLESFLLHDKKNKNGIRMSLLRNIGEPELQILIQEPQIQSSFQL